MGHFACIQTFNNGDLSTMLLKRTPTAKITSRQLPVFQWLTNGKYKTPLFIVEGLGTWSKHVPCVVSLCFSKVSVNVVHTPNKPGVTLHSYLRYYNDHFPLCSRWALWRSWTVLIVILCFSGRHTKRHPFIAHHIVHISKELLDRFYGKGSVIIIKITYCWFTFDERADLCYAPIQVQKYLVKVKGSYRNAAIPWEY